MDLACKKRIMAAFLGGAMALCSAVSVCLGMPVSAIAEAADAAALYCADFEDGKNDFSGRGGVETLEIQSETAHGGSGALKVSGRTESWNGPQLPVSDILQAGTEYSVSAFAMTDHAGRLVLSCQYDDASGTTVYDNIMGMDNDGNWAEYSTKFSFPADAANMYLYFEADDAGAAIYVDDFMICEAADAAIEDIPALGDVYAGYFKIGTAISPATLASKPSMALLEKHFSGSVTLENEMKPDFVLDQAASQAAGEDNPQVTLASAKPVLDYCAEHGIPVRGHTLIWHSQTPDWFFKEGFADDGEWVSKETMIVRMENYIKNLMEALKTQYPTLNLYAYDVVNEAWTDQGTPRQAGSSKSEGPETSAWVRIFGDNSFIEYAFVYARKYAPEGCKLYYNDFNEYIPAKTDAIIAMANDLKEKGLIDGIGIQSHLDVQFPSAAQYSDALTKLAATGLDIQVTELDATTSDTSEAGLEKQAKYYRAIMDAILQHKDSISAVVFWGIDDAASWRGDRMPLLFTGDYTAKPAFYAIADAASGSDSETAGTTETTTTTTETTTTTVEKTAAGTTTTTTTTVTTTTTTTTVTTEPAKQG